MATIKVSGVDNTLTHNTGDNSQHKGGTTDGVICRGPAASESGSESAGHVSAGSRDQPSQHSLRQAHPASLSPSLTTTSSSSHNCDGHSSKDLDRNLSSASAPGGQSGSGLPPSPLTPEFSEGIWSAAGAGSVKGGSAALWDAVTSGCPAVTGDTSGHSAPAQWLENGLPPPQLCQWNTGPSPLAVPFSVNKDASSRLVGNETCLLKPDRTESNGAIPFISDLQSNARLTSSPPQPDLAAPSVGRVPRTEPETGCLPSTTTTTATPGVDPVQLGVNRATLLSALTRCFSEKVADSSSGGTRRAAPTLPQGGLEAVTSSGSLAALHLSAGPARTARAHHVAGATEAARVPRDLNLSPSRQSTGPQPSLMLGWDRASAAEGETALSSSTSHADSSQTAVYMHNHRPAADVSELCLGAEDQLSSNKPTGHSRLPGLVAAETEGPASSLRACQESYLCGGSVSVLPPIVERAEGDASPVPPISEANDSEDARAMMPNGKLQKLDTTRGRRVPVEPFFLRSKSRQGLAESQHTNQADTAALNDANVRKIRKVGSHQLPTFILRQTSSSNQQNAESPGMASTQDVDGVDKTKEDKMKKTQANGSENRDTSPAAGSGSTQQTWQKVTMTPPDLHIVHASPLKSPSPPAGQSVYDLSMNDDTLRVDISHSKDLGSPGCKEKVQWPTRRSPAASVSDEDDFAEDGRSFKDWTEQKSARGVTRQDSGQQLEKMAAGDGVTAVKQASSSKVRTCSDGVLFQKKARHRSLDDTLADEDNPPPRHQIPFSPTTSTLSPSRRHSLSVTMETERVRRNSVSVLRARPSRVSSPLSRSSSPSERVTTVPKRRHSSKTQLHKLLRQDTQSAPDIAASLEFLSWTHLLSTYPQSELASATIHRSEVVVNIPVCHITKGSSSIKVTSVEAIEQTLTQFHPDLQVLLGSPTSTTHTDPSVPPPWSAGQHRAAPSTGQARTVSTAPAARKMPHVLVIDADKAGSVGDVGPPVSPSCTEDAKDQMTELNSAGKFTQQGKLLRSSAPAAETGDSPRRVSINTCIRTMREGSGNYDSQLMGCQNVGTYAEEETLKVVLAKSDAISCVISAMTAFLEKEELQRQACASLLKMASTSEANCTYISQNGGVTAIINTMRRYEDNLDVTKLALSILGYISTREGVKGELLSHGVHSDVLAAMCRRSDHRTIVCQCCFILGNLVISVETAQQLMLVGGVHTILSMLKRYHDDRDILENGCRALGSFALYDETCQDVGQAGATQCVVQAMLSPHTDLCVMECCCWALACLTSKAVTCEELVAMNGLDVLLRALEDFPQEEALQEYGVMVVCNLGALDSTAEHVSTSRVIDVLTSLYRNFPDNVELLEYMMLAFSQAAAVKPEVQGYMLTSGALRTVVGAMKALEENPAIQENGCRILGNMAVNESLRKSTEQQGASQVVISAMLNIDMCADTQLYGCMALMNLTAHLMDNKMRVKNNGAVPTLLATLRNFPDSAEVVLSALKTLGNLVDLEEACRQVLDDRGLPTIVGIAKNKEADRDIRSFAALVLSGLTMLPDLGVAELLEVGETLVTLQAELPEDPDLALSMCQGLHNLLKSEVGLDTLVHTGWLQVIENTMRTFTTHPDIHLTACRIVGTVAMECNRHVQDSSCPLTEQTVGTVLQSMRQFPQHKELQIVGCGTLSCVSENLGHLRSAIIKEGGLFDVTSAMTAFPTDDRLHSVGLIALSYLLPVEDDHKAETAAMVIDVISRSMSQFVEKEDIQISACRAFERCSVRDNKETLHILTSVHNAVRRHSTKTKVLKAVGRVFQRFGGEKAAGVTEEIINSPTTSPRDLFDRLLDN